MRYKFDLVGLLFQSLSVSKPLIINVNSGNKLEICQKIFLKFGLKLYGTLIFYNWEDMLVFIQKYVLHYNIDGFSKYTKF